MTGRLTALVLRELAVAAECDPRTIERVLRGQHAKGEALDRRIRRVLAERGLTVPCVDGARSYLPTPEL